MQRLQGGRSCCGEESAECEAKVYTYTRSLQKGHGHKCRNEFPLKSVGQAFKKARNGVIPEEHLDEIIGV